MFYSFQAKYKRKAKKNYGIPAKEASEFIADIFGKRVDNTFQIGLVESSSIDEKFSKFKSIWNSRESPYAPSGGPRFHEYFTRYHQISHAEGFV